MNMTKKVHLFGGDKPSQVDLTMIINFDEVNRHQKLTWEEVNRVLIEKKPLKNLNFLLKLNQYAKAKKRM